MTRRLAGRVHQPEQLPRSGSRAGRSPMPFLRARRRRSPSPRCGRRARAASALRAPSPHPCAGRGYDPVDGSSCPSSSSAIVPRTGTVGEWREEIERTEAARRKRCVDRRREERPRERDAPHLLEHDGRRRRDSGRGRPFVSGTSMPVQPSPASLPQSSSVNPRSSSPISRTYVAGRAIGEEARGPTRAERVLIVAER